MRDWLEEIGMAISHSTKTQLALALAVFSFVGFMLVGQLLVDRIELHGVMAPLTDVLRERLLHRYHKAASIAFVSFLLLAVRLYRKDRRRLLGR